MFKIAYGAGHNNQTTNGIPTSLHSPRVNEWQLNDRIARYFAQAAQEYQDVELLRVDDLQGVKPTVLADRVKQANDWGADFFLSIHHNAGINGESGGGLMAFCYREGTVAAAYREAIYAACIAAEGLKGDRWDSTQTANFYVLRYTTMPAVLMEYGFMDSTTDVPVILTDTYARAMGYATMEGIARQAGLKKKSQPAPQPQSAEVQVALQVLGQGSSGSQVVTVQRLLDSLGYDLGSRNPFDGSFGVKTAAAVRAYQQANGLTADGIVGSKTWSSLLGV